MELTKEQKENIRQMQNCIKDFKILGINQKKISEIFTTKYGSGYSKASISGKIKKGDPQLLFKLKELLKNREEHLPIVSTLSNDKPTQINRQPTEKELTYFNQSFALYYLHIEKGNTGIGKGLVHIGDSLDKVDFKNVGHSTRDCNGSFQIFKENYFTTTLKTITSGEKMLHLKVRIGEGEPSPIAIGTYSVINKSYSIEVGTVVMELLNNETESKLKTGVFQKQHAEFREINPLIIEYLNNRQLNHLKVSAQPITTYSDLGLFMKEHSNKRRRKVGINFDRFYFSFPHVNQSNERPTFSFDQLVTKLKTIIEENFFSEVIDFQWTYKYVEKLSLNSVETILHKIEKGIKESDKIVLFFPDKHGVQCALELGMALIEGHKILIYCKSKDDLPLRFNSGNQFVGIIEVEDFSSIPDRFSEDIADFFELATKETVKSCL